MHIRTMTRATKPVSASEFGDTLQRIVEILTVTTTVLAAIASIEELIKG